MKNRVTRGHKVITDSDMSEASIEYAIKEYEEKYYGSPIGLVACQSDAFYAGLVCNKYNLECILIPDEIMKTDSWLIYGSYNYIYSKGG